MREERIERRSIDGVEKGGKGEKEEKERTGEEGAEKTRGEKERRRGR